MFKLINKFSKLVLLFLLVSCSEKSPQASFEFAFLTDIHVQPERNAADGFYKAVNHVNQLNPDFVLTGGDLISDAAGQTYERSDSLYQLYTAISQQFNMPVHNTIGNHDLFALYNNKGVKKNHPEYRKKMFEKRLGKRYHSFKYQGWLFLLLDSIGETDSSYFGHIDSVQVEWIKNELSSIEKETPIVLVTHIPFFTIKAQFDSLDLSPLHNPHVINNSREVLTLFADYSLKLVLQGHLHFFEDLKVLNKTHFISAPAVSSRWWLGPNYGIEEGFLYFKIKGDHFNYQFIDIDWEVN